MKTLLLLSTIIIIIWLPQIELSQKEKAEPQSTSEKYTSTSFWEGKTFYTEFTPTDLSGTPSWNPKKGNPPITVSEAIQKSRAFLAKHFPNSVAWEIERITYDQFGKDKWVCVVEFALDKESSRDGHAASFSVFLKMDGTFFEPKVTATDKH